MMWQKLENILCELTKAYENLKALGQKKRELLIAVDMKSLEQLLKVEEKLLQSVDRLEGQRREVLVQLAGENPGLSAESGMRQVLQACPQAKREHLQEIHRILSDAVAAAQELSENNKILIVSALNAVNYHLNRVGSAAVEPSYGQKGQEMVSRQQKFDFQA